MSIDSDATMRVKLQLYRLCMAPLIERYSLTGRLNEVYASGTDRRIVEAIAACVDGRRG